MSPSTDGFRWRQEGTYLTVTGEAFAKKVAEESLKVEGPFSGYYYAARKTEDGHELWRTGSNVWDSVGVSVGATADPAAGANPAEVVVPAGKKWLLLAVANTMVTDANVAERYPDLYVTLDGTNVISRWRTTVPQTASTTAAWTFRPGDGGTTPSTLGANMMIGVGGCPSEIPAGGSFRVTYIGIQAGDNAAAVRYAYKELPT